MFSFIKNKTGVKRPVKSRNSAYIEAIKKQLNDELIETEHLKKMGIKSLFVQGAKVTKKMSLEDAVICLNVVRDAISKIMAFSEKFDDMADIVNEKINDERAAAIAGKSAMPTANDFYTVSNIVQIFKNVSANADAEDRNPSNVNDAIAGINVALTIFYIKADIAMSMINIKATSVGITMQN